MTEHDEQIMEVFKGMLPKLTERQKDRLLWIGEGILLKSETQEQLAPQAS